ncbi:MAG: dehydrogenase E1 component subunit alpha/beta [Roseiflexaceae bacterium]
MPKTLQIDPIEARRRGRLAGPTLAMNQYQPDPQAEANQYGAAALVRMYRDMLLIREFETLLDRLKKEGSYAGIAYNHRGPAHLSIGQEAAAVGLAFHLSPHDFIFGSHRSHGEILAKGLAAIDRLSETERMQIMEQALGGSTLRVVEHFSNATTSADIAIDYLLYGALAEIFGRETGFNRGMGGSMHAFFAPYGIMPNNAIVGGSADIATGAALYKRINRKPGIVIASIGDASLACGPVWEALNLAAMDQYRTLWDADVGGAPPILFNIMNNFYGMGGQPKGETMGQEVMARVAMGINPEAMHAERVDGLNPIAVADAVARMRSILERGQGPVLMETITYRFSGHSPSDASTYRDKSEIDLWRQHDSLIMFREYLLEHHFSDAASLDQLHTATEQRMARVLQAAIDPERSPRMDLTSDQLDHYMFSLQPQDRLDTRQPEALLPLEQTRLAQTQAKHRFGLDSEGKPLPKLRTLTYAEALFEAVITRFYQDPSMVAYGEENRDWGGAFGVYRGLTEALPYHRLFNPPIAEGAIVGSAVGYALCGGRALVELMYADFMGRAGDEIFNQMAKWQAMSGGVLTMPLVLRVSVGAKYGAQHSQDWSALVAHMPGLQVMYPATPYDAKGMLTLALRGSDPVVFFESQRLYPEPETIVPGGVPIDDYEVPLGEPAIRRIGSDLTIITLGAALTIGLAAASELHTHGIEAEVIDLRFINPLNYAPLVESVRKTGKVILVSEACERGSFMHTVAANLSQLCFDDLDGPPAVVGARNWITPPAELEESFFPQPAWIVDTLHERIAPIAGYTPRTRQATTLIIDRNRRGV